MSEIEQLGARERQIVEAVYRLGEGSVSDVLETLSDPPGYSAVRAMLNILVQKEHLDFRREGNRYLYRPVKQRDAVRKSMLRNLLENFFGGNAGDAVAALLDLASDGLEKEDYAKIRKMIEEADNKPQKNKR